MGAEMIWTRTVGGTTTGNTARRLLFDPLKRQVLVDCVPVSTRADGKCESVVFDNFIMSFSINIKSCFFPMQN